MTVGEFLSKGYRKGIRYVYEDGTEVPDGGLDGLDDAVLSALELGDVPENADADPNFGCAVCTVLDDIWERGVRCEGSAGM